MCQGGRFYELTLLPVLAPTDVEATRVFDVERGEGRSGGHRSVDDGGVGGEGDAEDGGEEEEEHEEEILHVCGLAEAWYECLDVRRMRWLDGVENSVCRGRGADEEVDKVVEGGA